MSISVRNLNKTFESAAGPLEILSGVDFELADGEAAVITGPSGSGKSTFLYVLGLLEQPTSGEVNLFGETPYAWSESRQAKFRNERIGFVFQDHHLLPQCTVIENVLLPVLAFGKAGKSDQDRATELIDRVGLSHRIDHRPAKLSGGERQRVALCRSLINEPDLLLADEPTGNLDTATADNVGDLLLALGKERGTTLVCVTHSLQLAERFPLRFSLKDKKLVRPEAGVRS
ncbi:ABC transporter ATP-binding protein [Stratiformator vulcanicus]|uniref:Lipoprotein-releasing system ATP-binding protein LolD n=1 Tax=Stratiformator vulcanicus TaxID=2527980 RepID=A0A517R0S6_9PLAN|nr:ABC transporter ATP-binding protein [Stratiformator vulcanicus]QDT37443.1 Lipoprotein-releasing system ATP-binding protein LolD [Stratiformator vulcanicus]